MPVSGGFFSFLCNFADENFSLPFLSASLKERERQAQKEE